MFHFLFRKDLMPKNEITKYLTQIKKKLLFNKPEKYGKKTFYFTKI